MINSIHLYRSVPPLKINFEPILVQIDGEGKSTDYFSFVRYKDTSGGLGNKRGLIAMITPACLVEWEKEDD